MLDHLIGPLKCRSYLKELNALVFDSITKINLWPNVRRRTSSFNECPYRLLESISLMLR